MSNSKVVPFKTVRAMMLADLARSGLTAEDAKKLGVEPLTKDETERLVASKVTGRFHVCSYKIPYRNADGSESGMFRLKFLEDVKDKKGKAIKYWQAEGSTPKAFFAPFCDWLDVADDPSVAIVITEGEKKAAKTTRMGVPTIGLGGVWSWQSKRLGVSLIPELAAFKLQDRSVFLCFDTDAEPKPEVMGALEALGHVLESRGAIVEQIKLPAPPGQKMGLDDYLVEHSIEEFKKLPRDGLATGAEMEALNHEVAIIENPGGIFHIATGVLHNMPTQLASTIYASRLVRKVNGAGQFVDANALIEWTKWRRQRRHAGIVYRPGQARVTRENYLNTWKGWGVDPKKGDVSNLEYLLDHVFGTSADSRSWFLKWLAYPIQNPGTKLYTASVLWSNEQGSGKSIMGYTVKRVYGDNFVQINEDDLHSQFNSWRANRQFVLGEEITGSDARREANKLKGIITNETCRLNEKHQKVYELDDVCNYFFTANGPDCFLIDAHDRRYFIHEARSTTTEKMRKSESWFTGTYDAWYRSEEGAAAIMWYLLEKVDCTGFDARARAPMTDAKESMAQLSGGDADVLARDLIAAPARYLKLGETQITRDLFTLTELFDLLNPGKQYSFTLNTLGRALARLGAKALPVTNLPTGPARLVPVRNIEKWTRATHAERVAGYTGQEQKKREKKF